MENLVSILVPCYNCEKFLENCLNSLINQSYKNLEIVCVNDGSIDNTLEILNNFALKDKRIKVFNKENEKSISKTRNFLLQKANGKYLTWVDSDDWVEKNYILDMVNAMENENVDLVICGYQKDKKINAKQKKIKRYYEIDNNIETLKKMIAMKPYLGYCWAKLYKTNIAKSILFDTDVNFSEDMLFNCKYLLVSKSSYYFNTSNYHYIQHKSSIMHSKIDENKLTILKSSEKIIELTKNVDNQLYNNAVVAHSLNCLNMYYQLTISKIKNKQLNKYLLENMLIGRPLIKNNKYFMKILRFALPFGILIAKLKK